MSTSIAAHNEQSLVARQENENILASSCGDGSIKVWDLAAPPHANPLRSFQEHTREVTSTASLCYSQLHMVQLYALLLCHAPVSDECGFQRDQQPCKLEAEQGKLN